MNNKIIGIVIGVLILGVVIFSGMNNPEMSPSMLDVKDKFKSTGPTFPEVMPVDMSAKDCHDLAGCQITLINDIVVCDCGRGRTVTIDTLR